MLWISYLSIVWPKSWIPHRYVKICRLQIAYMYHWSPKQRTVPFSNFIPVEFECQDFQQFAINIFLLKQFSVQIGKWCAVEYCWQFTIICYSWLPGRRKMLTHLKGTMISKNSFSSWMNGWNLHFISTNW